MNNERAYLIYCWYIWINKKNLITFLLQNLDKIFKIQQNSKWWVWNSFLKNIFLFLKNTKLISFYGDPSHTDIFVIATKGMRAYKKRLTTAKKWNFTFLSHSFLSFLLYCFGCCSSPLTNINDCEMIDFMVWIFFERWKKK
jgi:hypothetical protein